MIVIDARMVEASGIGRYIKNITLGSGIYDHYLGDEVLLKKYFSPDKIIEYTSRIYGAKEQLTFPYSKIPKNSLLHCPHYNIPLLYSGDLVVTVHDITHILFPEYLPNKAALLYARFMIQEALKKSKYVLTDSENTKNDLIKHFRVNPEKINVVYNSIEDMFKKINNKESLDYLYKKFNIPRDKILLLYVGNKKPHKNLERLLYAFSEIKHKDDCFLILVGKGFDGYKNLEEVSFKLNLNDRIRHTGVVDDVELVGLYNIAEVFVYPSLYEGFGYPPLEAMACGVPVISSNTSSLPEVLGAAAYYTNPYDIHEIKNAIDEVIESSSLRNSLVQKGFKQVALYTKGKQWDELKNILNMQINAHH